MHDLIPTTVPDSWLQVHHAPQAKSRSQTPEASEEASRTFAVVASSPDVAAVEEMVQEAFQNVLKLHACAEHEHSDSDAAVPSIEAQSGHASNARHAALPLWLVLLMHVSLLLNIDCISCSGLCMVAVEIGTRNVVPNRHQSNAASESEETVLLVKQLVVARNAAVPAAWGLLSVLVPLLEPIAPFCRPVKVREEEASMEASCSSSRATELSWAAQLWRMHLAMSRAVLEGAEAGSAEGSRGIAGFVLNLVAHRAGQIATRNVCDYILSALIHCSDTSKGEIGTACPASNLAGMHTSSCDGSVSVQKESEKKGKKLSPKISEVKIAHARFQFVFGVHLLQTALRRQQLPVSAVLALVEEVGNVVQCVCGAGGVMHAGTTLEMVDQSDRRNGTENKAASAGIENTLSCISGVPRAEGESEAGAETASKRLRSAPFDESDRVSIPLEDRVQLLVIAMSTVSLAMQTPLATQQRMQARATAVLAAAAMLLTDSLQSLKHNAAMQNPSSHPSMNMHAAPSLSIAHDKSSTGAPVATNSPAVPASAILVQSLCNMMQQLLPVVVSDSVSAVQLVSLCVEAVVLTACSLPVSSDIDIPVSSAPVATKEKDVVSPRDLSPRKADGVGEHTSGLGATGPMLLSAAAGLLSCMVNSTATSAPQHMHAVLLCFASLSVPVSLQQQFDVILQRVASWHVTHACHASINTAATAGKAATMASDSMHAGSGPLTLDAAKSAAVMYMGSQGAAMKRGHQECTVPVGAATALLEALVRGGAASRKVLVAPGA